MDFEEKALKEQNLNLKNDYLHKQKKFPTKSQDSGTVTQTEARFYTEFSISLKRAERKLKAQSIASRQISRF